MKSRKEGVATSPGRSAGDAGLRAAPASAPCRRGHLTLYLDPE